MNRKTDKDVLYGLAEYYDRFEPSEDTISKFEKAKEEGDLQKQLDIIWDMIVAESNTDDGDLEQKSDN